jgi:hypothetical protein
MQALSEAGVPIVAVQKKGYSLAKGYFLPPLRFTTEEALILALGSDFMGHNFDDQYRAAAEAAYRKIDAVLPDTLRQEVSYLSTNISFFAANPLSEKQRENLCQLRSAIAERRTVHFHYSQKKACAGYLEHPFGNWHIARDEITSLLKHVRCEYNQYGSFCSYPLATRLFLRRRASIGVSCFTIHQATGIFQFSYASGTLLGMDQTVKDFPCARDASRSSSKEIRTDRGKRTLTTPTDYPASTG